MTELELTFPPSAQSVKAARDALRGLDRELEPGLLADARLLVSELVTNCLRHADLRRDGWVRLAVRVDDDVVRIEVVDPGSGFRPQRLGRLEDGTAGWGLYLVARLATSWGVRRDDVTRVWAELPRRSAAPTAGW